MEILLGHVDEEVGGLWLCTNSGSGTGKWTERTS